MPKIVDRDKQKAEILSASFPLFASMGFGVVGMRQCARELGVSTGTLYHYFASKDVLFEQMYLQKSRQMVQLLVERIPTCDDPEVKIDALVGFVQENLSDLQRMLVMAFDFRRNGTEASELLNQSFLFFRASLQTMLGIKDVEKADQILVLVFGVISRETLLSAPLDLTGFRGDLQRLVGSTAAL